MDEARNTSATEAAKILKKISDMSGKPIKTHLIIGEIESAHFEVNDTKALLAAIANRQIATTRQEWDVRHLMTQTIADGLGTETGYVKLIELLSSLGLESPSEGTYQLITVLLLLSDKKEVVAGKVKNAFLKSVKGWWTQHKVKPQGSLVKVVFGPQCLREGAPDAFARVYGEEPPTKCPWGDAKIAVLLEGSWMRWHKSRDAALPADSPKANPGESSMQQMMMQMLSTVMTNLGAQQQHQPLQDLKIVAPQRAIEYIERGGKERGGPLALQDRCYDRWGTHEEVRPLRDSERPLRDSERNSWQSEDTWQEPECSWQKWYSDDTAEDKEQVPCLTPEENSIAILTAISLRDEEKKRKEKKKDGREKSRAEAEGTGIDKSKRGKETC